MIRTLAIVVFFIGATGAAVFAWGHAAFTQPGPTERPITLVIEPGSGLRAIATDLHVAGVIDNPVVFRLGVRAIGLATQLQAGEFVFPAAISAREAAELIADGKTVLRRFTIAEGLTSAEIVDQLNAVDGLQGYISGSVPEGRLMPETYYFSFGDDRNAIVERMKTAMDETLDTLWKTRKAGLPIKSKREALILASIVEKETGIPDERARVAAVFINRLQRGMRLQSDPTVAYGVTEGHEPLGRALTRTDLKTPTPYNTYTINGLPPGPIANPGRAAIEAVLNPLETDELYFVADGTGGHVFAKTLDEHNRNVRKWRKIRDQLQDASN